MNLSNLFVKERGLLIYLGAMETLRVGDYEGFGLCRSKYYHAVEVFLPTPFTVTQDFQPDQMISGSSAETAEFISFCVMGR